ncbi:uncharacterized protein YALI1_D20531g [Yarrowia lipolytica]|uniref:Uncharacterized protein n=1 Tax=Yarrowia lipolytica TaxID=4952 RepID=A0A1D8NEU2_YARLL|nr:hypothetical protein YALI1_D20531g [Yarrowia lipolytica]
MTGVLWSSHGSRGHRTAGVTTPPLSHALGRFFSYPYQRWLRVSCGSQQQAGLCSSKPGAGTDLAMMWVRLWPRLGQCGGRTYFAGKPACYAVDVFAAPFWIHAFPSSLGAILGTQPCEPCLGGLTDVGHVVAKTVPKWCPHWARVFSWACHMHLVVAVG